MRSKVGGCLFKLCKAIEYQVDDGPVDAVTQESKFSLAEERLLRVKVDPQPLVVGHLIKYSRESFYMRPHHILFMRCICIYFSQECYHRGHRAGILRSCKLQIDRLRYNLSSEVQGNESSLQEQTVLIHSFARPIWTQWDRVNQLWWWFKKKKKQLLDRCNFRATRGWARKWRHFERWRFDLVEKSRVGSVEHFETSRHQNWIHAAPYLPAEEPLWTRQCCGLEEPRWVWFNWSLMK